MVETLSVEGIVLDNMAEAEKCQRIQSTRRLTVYTQFKKMLSFCHTEASLGAKVAVF